MGLTQGWAGQTDAMLFAKSQCLAAAVDFVCQNASRITAIALPISGHRPSEILRFIEEFEIQTSHSGVAVHQSDMQFCAELDVGVGLSLNDGPGPRLGQTDNAPGNAVVQGFKHEALLLIDSGNDIQTLCLL